MTEPTSSRSASVTDVRVEPGAKPRGEVTQVPSRSVDVLSAAATRVGMVANHGESASDRHARWRRR